MTRFAVAGATGRLGRHVVDVLTERGHDVVPMSRALGVDLVTGEHLAESLAGVDVIIDAASWHASEQDAATEFFRASTRNLHAAGVRAGVGLIAVASVIGVDGATAGFGAAKKVHEELHLSGAIPVRILRAAQFHEFVGQLLDWQGDPAYIPTWPSQLVSARTAAEALVDLSLAVDPVLTPVPEIAGPVTQTLAEAATILAARRGTSVIGVDNRDLPDADYAAAGGLLPNPHATLAGPAFEEWLDTQP